MMLEKIIIMLTHNDKTVPDAIEILMKIKTFLSSTGDLKM